MRGILANQYIFLKRRKSTARKHSKRGESRMQERGRAKRERERESVVKYHFIINPCGEEIQTCFCSESGS